MVTALEKRIKRHVVGKTHDFFVATAPGLEELCLTELAALGLNGRAIVGGVGFTGRLPDCYLANLHLRTASRVLMRLHVFQSVHFSELEKSAESFSWELFLRPGSLDKIHVTTHRCRLHHTDAIAIRIREGIERRLGTSGNGDRTGVSQQLFVRGVHDRFTVSIDSSGENLYLRGIKTHHGKAPLRETLAAAALMHAGFSSARPLLDPMCGTGTFALEAALRAKNIPPGWFREFAFVGWPGFRPHRWNHIRRKAGEPIRTLDVPGIFASDIDPAACRQLGECLGRCSLSDAVTVACRDFFDLDPRDITDRPGLVTLNPPYGRRMGDAAGSRELVRAIIGRIRSRYAGWKFVLIVPAARDLPEIGLPVQAHPFIHGGLQATVMVGAVPAS